MRRTINLTGSYIAILSNGQPATTEIDQLDHIIVGSTRVKLAAAAHNVGIYNVRQIHNTGAFMQAIGDMPIAIDPVLTTGPYN